MNVTTLPSGQAGLLILPTGVWTSVFDTVGLVQERLKGNHFCELALQACPEGMELVRSQYDSRFYFPPRRFEGLLQDIRDDFKGTSFQLIEVVWNGTRFITRPIHGTFA